MKITKDNYNELKSKDLENNYAKVWQVNEIREELLANTGSGEVTSVEGLTGQITFQDSRTTIPNIRTSVDEETNSVILNYKVPYHEINFRVNFALGGSNCYMHGTNLEEVGYSASLINTTDIVLTPDTPFMCTSISTHMTMNNAFGTSPNLGFVEIPKILLQNAGTGEVRFKIQRDDGDGIVDTEGLKTSVEVSIKIFGFLAFNI